MVTDMDSMQPGIKTEIVFVTPEIAKQFLGNNDPAFNRRPVKSHVNEIADAILSGGWVPSHQGIAFDDSGRLLDGQHRLMAVVKANTGVWMQVNRGVPQESFFYIDTSKRRTLSFRSGLSQSQTEIAAFLLRAANADDSGLARKTDVVEIAKALQQPMDLLQQVAPTRAAIISSASVRAACVMAMLCSSDPKFSLKTYRDLTLRNIDSLPPIGCALIKQLLAKKLGKGGGSAVQKAHYLKFRFVFDAENQYRTKLALEQPEGDFIKEVARVVSNILLGGAVKPVARLPSIEDFA